ncbi:MAG TPA: alpha amylase C-terminal domain-containing protein, partial [Ideonella sp.]|nr:alpha amylase C-terminal domain-containing protein [Ideonella sp.]
GALHEVDFAPAGFEWIEHRDAERSIFAFVRHARDDAPPVLVVGNFTPTVHRRLRLGVPRAGRWHERINTDSEHYGGSNVGTPFSAAYSEGHGAHGRAQSIVVDLPPLATVMYQWSAS